MKLLRLQLTNFCRLKSAAVEFHQGMTAILGPNGQGKSSIFAAIIWLLTGENVLDGTKDENISQYAGPKDKSNGTLVFSHNDIVYTITRHLRPGTKAALLAGETQLALGDSNVTTEVLNLLQVDPKILRTYMVVLQGELFSFIDQDQSERSQRFQRFFGTWRCQDIAKGLAKHRAGLTIPAVIDVDELQRQCDAAGIEAARGQQILDTYPAVAELIAQRDTVQDRLRQGLRRDQLVASITNLQQTIVNGQQQLQQLQQTLQPEQAKKATCETQFATSRSQYADWQRLELAWQQYQLQASREQTFLANVTSARNQLQLLPPLVPFTEADERRLSTLQSTQIELRTKATQLQQRLARMPVGVAACPTCEQATDKLQAQLQLDQQWLANAAQQVTELQNEINRLTQLRTTATLVQSTYDKAQQNCRSADEALATFNSTRVPQPTVALSTVQQAIESHNALAKQLQQLTEFCSRQEQQLQLLRTTAEGWQTTLVREQTELAGITLSDAELLAARTALQDLTTTIDNRNLAAEHAVRKHTDHQNLLRRVAEARQQQLAADRTRRWQSTVSELETLYHYDGLPKIVSQGCLTSLQSTVNEFLRALAVDFRVVADESLSFTATFPDNRVMRAKRLSFGQKVGLGLAFQLAVNFQFLGHLGVLLLDEPTAWLDAEHVQALIPLFEKLRTVAASRGLQTVLITHEESLRPAFDRIITLGT